MRKCIFSNGEFYHVYNRGTDRREIFSDQYDVDRFLQSMQEFNVEQPIGSIYQNSFRKKEESLRSRTSKPLVSFVAYCLNPNHFHLLLRQVSDKGIEKFMQRIGTGYTKYFNAKFERSGVLFQGKFQAKHIDSNEYLLHASVYVNLNGKVHQLEDASFHSSWGEYQENVGFGVCDKDPILGQFRNSKEYQDFAKHSLSGILEKRGKYDEMKDVFLE